MASEKGRDDMSVSIQEWIERGERGEPVWLNELRESGVPAEDGVQLILRLDNGAAMERVYKLPR